MRIFICPSAHGFGHNSRQLALGKKLLQRGHDITFFTHVPNFVKDYLPQVNVVEANWDVGLAQQNPIAIDIKKVGEGKDPWGNYRAGFSGMVSFTRSDWGITNNLGPNADTTKFELTIEGIRQ